VILCYTALSPFCRKVHMVMDWKGIDHELFDSCDIKKYPAYNPRGEIPILVDGPLTVVNSADILGYLDRKFPAANIYPTDPTTYANVRTWEREADTYIDAIVTDIAVYKWADIPPAPDGLIDAARRDLADVYDRMEQTLAGQDYIAGALSVADFALYPHIGSAQLIRIGTNTARHPNVLAWINRMSASEIGQRDAEAKMQWWSTRDQHGLDTKRINWGTHRLEWFLANGFLDYFVDEVRGDRVLWSVGPNTNAAHSPHAPLARGS
jgi:glutathione S-transferase